MYRQISLLSVFLISIFSSSTKAEDVVALSQELATLVAQKAPEMPQPKVQRLESQIRDLIQFVEEGGHDRDPHRDRKRLICQTSGDKAALYDLDAQKFIDRYYSKTLEECNQVKDASNRGLTCVSNSGKHAIYNLNTDAFIDQYYSKSFDDCMKTLRRSRNGLTCATANGGEKNAIYDVRNSRFVDQYYSKTLDECLDSL